MTEASDERVTRAVAHFLACRRLRDRMRDYGQIDGLIRLLAFHTAQAATLADALCSGAGVPYPAPAAMPFTGQNFGPDAGGAITPGPRTRRDDGLVQCAQSMLEG
jgi:hypothetical protein